MSETADRFIGEVYDYRLYDYETFDTYAEAVAFVNEAADAWEEEGVVVDRGWASQDNMYCVHVTEGRWAQVIRAPEA